MRIQALLAVVLLPLSFLVARPTNAHAGAPTFPIRAAFYYPWFPETWGTASSRYTWYTPAPLGYYNSSDTAVIDNHIARMEYAGINVGIASWWGQGSKTDLRVSLLLARAHARSFYWTLYYEPAMGSQVASDLTYISAKYGSDPNFLHVSGKPVLFIYTRAVKSCADVATWQTANAGRFYLDPQVFSGYRACAVQPSSWHQYAPTSAEDRQTPYSFAISPGFWLKTDSAPRLVRDPARWRANIHDMVASGAQWQLITTFNEWGEGTAVEDAAQWNSSTGFGMYLDALHAALGSRPGAASSAPAPVRPPAGQPNPVQSGSPGDATQEFMAVVLVIQNVFKHRAWRLVPR